MKHFKIALAAAAILLTGCWQKSIHPFYKTSQLTYDEKLIGDWHEPDDADTTWSFAKGDLENVYRVKVADKETKLDMDGRLFKIGDQKYLDFHSRGRAINDAPAHALFRVREISPALKMDILNINWVKQWAEKHPNDIAGVLVMHPDEPANPEKAEYILTADTDALQKFIETHKNDEGFWEPIKDMKKK